MLMSIILAFISIWSVWTPFITNHNHYEIYSGEFNGYFPWSRLSYPLYISVYHTPFIHLHYDGIRILGNVVFKFFLVNVKVMEVRGEFYYPPVMGITQLHYSLNFPFFNDGEKFFIFLLIIFTFLNIIGTLLALALTYVFLERRQNCVKA
jgi:hypothetical protein